MRIETETFLRDLSRAGVILSVIGDQLHVKAPKGVLTPQLKHQLAFCKPDLLAIFCDAERPDPTRILAIALKGLPTCLEEVLAARLIDCEDMQDISMMRLTAEKLRLYFASWILHEKQIPFQLVHDYEYKLGVMLSN